MFEDTSLDMGMTDLHISTMNVTRLHARVYKVTSLDFWTRLPSIDINVDLSVIYVDLNCQIIISTFLKNIINTYFYILLMPSRHNFLTSRHHDLASRHNYYKVVFRDNFVNKSDITSNCQIIMSTCQMFI